MAERPLPKLPAHVGPLRDRHARQAGGPLPKGADAHPSANRRRVGVRIAPAVAATADRPVNRALERATDPLFRRAGLNLDHE
jgi:hypothetical protein